VRGDPLLVRAWRLLRSPQSEWAAIAAERSRPLRVFLTYVLPMSALPAIAWAIGIALFPGDLAFRGETVVDPGSAGQLARTALVTFAGSVLAVGTLAAAFFAIAPMYEVRRDWPSALSVAAYGTTPVWLAGVLFVKPSLVSIAVLAVVHACYLYFAGLQRVAGVKRGDAAEFVALAVLLTTIALVVVGALLGFMGAI
jgi:Yip1 domain